ncbi:MAG: GIY-YIG nuclease family protein [Elusimicrobiota bacterium]
MTKQQILDEIRRTSTTNGGIPLGIGKFFSETGIKRSDWMGRYWARWNDALKEAGFAPNKMTSGFDRAYLVEKVIELIRALGRLPSEGDVRMWKRKNADYPSHNAFRRLGSKVESVQAVLDQCKGKDSFADIIPLCEAYLNDPPQIADMATTAESSDGHVYLLKSGRYYKIGKTNALGRREYELSIQLPDKASTVHSIKTDDPTGIEAYWHKRFETKRKNGEWFDLAAADVNAFRRRKFM